ncbi:MAG: type II toxin-antitoxin system RelE/ParE family toxin [Syntrophomonadaceae bacterium]|nr:type II toxin-antitoxin system RelE/ParE family toxin [Syntrophomonadaceae bacterium]
MIGRFTLEDNLNIINLLIYESIRKLSDFPEIGAVIPEEDAPGAQRGYRRIVVTPYSIFYRVLEDRIVIARVLHGRQNWIQSIFPIYGKK